MMQDLTQSLPLIQSLKNAQEQHQQNTGKSAHYQIVRKKSNFLPGKVEPISFKKRVRLFLIGRIPQEFLEILPRQRNSDETI